MLILLVFPTLLKERGLIVERREPIYIYIYMTLLYFVYYYPSGEHCGIVIDIMI